MTNRKVLLVGDNPFQGVSHLSQERARARDNHLSSPEHAARLVGISLENGADGFMFSVSRTTLSILRRLDGWPLQLYAIAPAAYDYVRLASQRGTPGLGLYVARQVLASRNFSAIANGVKGVVCRDPVDLMKAYLSYEIRRVRASVGRNAKLSVFLLHEIVTDMALALNLDWLFRSYVDFILRLRIKPGFETRNFSYLVNRFREWSIDLSRIAIVAPFNSVGFQMSPSKAECESALNSLPETEVIAMSMLASGYIGLAEALEYVRRLPQLSGVVIGISKREHAHDFKSVREALDDRG